MRRHWLSKRPIFRWGILALLGTLVCKELLNRVDASAGGDLEIYREAGEAVLAGQIPYRDFLIEYPPGSLPAFVPPALFGSSDYNFFFAAEMALVLVASMFLTAAASRRFRKPWLLPALVIAAGALLLSDLPIARYDVVITFALAGAAWATAARRPTPAWAFLGLGTLAKLTPVLVAAALYPLSEPFAGDAGVRRRLARRLYPSLSGEPDGSRQRLLLSCKPRVGDREFHGVRPAQTKRGGRDNLYSGDQTS